MRTLTIALVALFVAVAAPAQDARVNQFIGDFEKAMLADNFNEMQSLVKQGGDTVKFSFIAYEAQWCAAVAANRAADKAQREKFLETLAKVSSLTQKDDFCKDRLLWLKSLSPEAIAKKAELDEALNTGSTLYGRADRERQDKAWDPVIEHFTKFIGMAQAIPDVYWEMVGCFYLGDAHKGKLEYFESCYWYKKAAAVGLAAKFNAFVNAFGFLDKAGRAAKDGNFREDFIEVALPVAEAKAKWKTRVEDAAKAPAEAGGAPKIANAPANLPPPANVHTMKLEWVDADKSKISALAGGRPAFTTWYQTNAHWYFWSAIGFKGGDKAKLPFLPGEHDLRNDKGKVLLDPDGAGKGAEEQMKIPQKAEIVSFKGRKYNDGTVGDVHVRMVEGPYQYKIMGQAARASREGGVVQFRWQGAMQATTKFDGLDIAIYDEDADGTFTSYGKDCVVIGKGKDAVVQPLSQYVYLKGLLFQMKLDPSGTNIRFKPYDGPVAPLKIEWKAASTPQSLIFNGQGDIASFYVNVLEAKDKPLWVPVGEYRLFSGYFAFGDAGEKRETILISPGRSGVMRVIEGRMNTLELGAAKEPGFRFLWKAETYKEKGEDMVRVLPKELKVIGCFGEEYEWFQTGVVRPLVKMRIGEKGAPFHDKEMAAPDKEDFNKDSQLIWLPHVLEVKKPGAGEVWIQMECNYPKLGKIGSKWERVD